MATTRKKKKPNFDTSELKNWVMFLFALGLLYGMFKRGDALNAWWTLLIGAMLSLTTLMVAVENIMTVFRKGSNGKYDGSSGGTDGDTGKESEGPTPSGPGSSQSNQRNRQPSRPDQDQVAGIWHACLLVLGSPHASPV